MGDSSTDVLDPRVNEENFMFAFDDFDFSDRVLHLEIIPDDDCVDSYKKLNGEKYHEWFSCIHDSHSKDSESCVGAKVKTLHISSPILAAKSPFMYKLFKNGMRESQHKNDVSLRIKASEEATLMDLLKFMYGKTDLSATSAPDLVDVLLAADKFEVTSCMKYCIEMFLKLAMSLESALLYLELPSSVLGSDIVKPLIDVAKQYVAAHYRDFSAFQGEAIELPLSAVEVVLENEGLRVDSEDDVFDFILKWGRASYPELEERQEILTTRLAQLVCFSNMSSSKLKEVLVCPDFDHEQVSKLVVEALFSKVELTCGQQIHPSKDLTTTTYCDFSGRVYKPRCVVYFDLKKDDWKSISLSKPVNSQPFYLGGKQLYLSAQCGKEQQHLGLYVCKEPGSETSVIDFEFSVMMKSPKEFLHKAKAKNLTLSDEGWGVADLLGIPWTNLMSQDNEYFINNVLRIRAEITLNNSNA